MFEVRPDLFPQGFLTDAEMYLWGLYYLEKNRRSSVADLEKTVQIIFEAIDNMTDPMGEMGTALSGFGGKASEVSEKADTLGDAIETIPADLELDITLEDNASDGINDIQHGISDIPEEKEICFDCDPSAIAEVNDLIDDMPAEHELDIYLAGDPYSDISDIGEGIDELPEAVELDIGVEAGDYARYFHRLFRKR